MSTDEAFGFPAIPILAEDLQVGDFVRDQGKVKMVTVIGSKTRRATDSRVVYAVIGEQPRLLPPDERVFVHLEDKGL